MTDDETIVQPHLLDSNDRQSPTWRKLKTYMESRLIELRLKNDNDMSEISTAKLRGSLMELKNLLALGDQDPTAEVDED